MMKHGHSHLDDKSITPAYAHQWHNEPYELVLWSGGLDSTALVHRLLKAGKRVMPMYVEIANNTRKTKAESLARQAMADILANMFPRLLNYPRRIMSIDVDTQVDSVMFKQMPIWLLALVLGTDCGDDRRCQGIHLGYVMGDQGISMMQEMEEVWKAYGGLTHGQLPALHFPLRKYVKYQLLEELPEQLRPLVFHCEEPRVKERWKVDLRTGEVNRPSKILPLSDAALAQMREPKLGDYLACGHCVACKRAISEGIMKPVSDPYEERIRQKGLEALRMEEKAEEIRQKQSYLAQFDNSADGFMTQG